MNKTTKPTKPVQLPSMTEEEKKASIERALAQERKQYFQLILANLCQNPNAVRETQITVKGTDGIARAQLNILDIVDAAIEGSAYVMEKMYSTEEPKEEK